MAEPQQRHNKRIYLLLGVLMAAIMLSSPGRSLNINERALVHAMGIDKHGDSYTVTLQVFKPSGSGADTSVDVSQPNVQTVVCKGRTVSQAIDDGRAQLGREPFLGHLQLICLGRETDLSHPEELFEFATGGGVDLGTELCISNTTAEDIMSTRLSYAETSAEAIGLIIKLGEEYSRTVSCRLIDILSLGDGGSAAIPMLTARETDGKGGQESQGSQSSPEAESTVKLTSTAIMTDGSICRDELTEEEALAVDMLTGRAKKAAIVITLEGSPVSVELENISTHRSLKLENGRLIYHAKIRADIRTDPADKESRQRLIKNTAEEKLASICKSAEEKALRKNGADIFGLCRLIKHSQPKTALAHEGSLDALYPCTDFDTAFQLRPG